MGIKPSKMVTQLLENGDQNSKFRDWAIILLTSKTWGFNEKPWLDRAR